MKRTCIECHNTHPQSPHKDWQEGDVLLSERLSAKSAVRVEEATTARLGPR
jgi:hypothetical protein